MAACYPRVRRVRRADRLSCDTVHLAARHAVPSVAGRQSQREESPAHRRTRSPVPKAARIGRCNRAYAADELEAVVLAIAEKGRQRSDSDLQQLNKALGASRDGTHACARRGSAPGPELAGLCVAPGIGPESAPSRNRFWASMKDAVDKPKGRAAGGRLNFPSFLPRETRRARSSPTRPPSSVFSKTPAGGDVGDHEGKGRAYRPSGREVVE